MPQGTVKWFNNAKGYGFVIEDGQAEDLFVHFSSIQMEGYKTLKAGQPVMFDKQPSGKGTHAVNIRLAETAENHGSAPSEDNAFLDDEIISVDESNSAVPASEEQVAERSTDTTERV